MSLPLHTDAFLKSLDLIPKKKLEDYTQEEMRIGYTTLVNMFGATFTPVYKVEDLFVPSNHIKDFNIPVRFYLPNEQTERLWIYVHGGGWCRGSIENYDTHMREMANTLGIAILSVEYRLAPENPFPSAHQDVYDVYQWVKSTFQKEHNFKSIYLGGDSAGGNITAGTICRLIEEHIPLPDLYIGFYPSLDFSLSQDSYTTFETGYILTKASVKFYIDQYIKQEENRYNFLAAPLLYKKLCCFPKSLILTADCDPLRDEQNEFVQCLKDYKIEVQQKIVPGVVHPFMIFSRVFPEVAECISWLKDEINKID